MAERPTSMGEHALGVLTDIGLLLFLILQTWSGWRSGLLWQVTAMATLIVGITLGATLAPLLAQVILGSITNNLFHAQLVSFLFVAGIVGLVLRLLATWAEVQSEQGIPKEEREQRRVQDRILGGIFGALKGSILALVFVAGMVGLWPTYQAWQASKLAGPFATAGTRMLPDGSIKQMQEWMSDSSRVATHSLQIRLTDMPEREPDPPTPPEVFDHEDTAEESASSIVP